MSLNYGLAVGGIAEGMLILAYIALYLFPNLKSVAGPLILNTKGSAAVIPSYLGAKTFLFVGIGFFLLYSAALLH